MGRSGSTWSFNVVKLLMREHSETTHACYTDDVASSFMEAGALPEHIIVKCHTPDYFGRFLIKHNMCRTVYTFREPLEVLTSALETFGGDFDPHLSGLTSSLELLQYQVETGGVHSIWYDDIIERSHERVAALADYLGIECSRQRCDEIATMMERENVRRILSEMAKSGQQTKTAMRFFNRPDKIASWDSGTLFSDHHIRKAPSAPEDFLTQEQIARAIEAFSGFVDSSGRLLDVVKNIGRLETADPSAEPAKLELARRSANLKPSEIVVAARQAFDGRFGDPSSPKGDNSPDEGAKLDAVLARLTSTPAELPVAHEPVMPPPPDLPHIEPQPGAAPFSLRATIGASPFAKGPDQRLMQAPPSPAPVNAGRQPTPPVPFAQAPVVLPAIPLKPAPIAQPIITAPLAPPTPAPSPPATVISSTPPNEPPLPPTHAELAAERVLNRRSRSRMGDTLPSESGLLNPAVQGATAGLAELKPRIARPDRPSIDPLTGEALTPAELAARLVLARRQQQADIPSPRAFSRAKPLARRTAAAKPPKATWADVEQALLHEPAPVAEMAETSPDTPERRGNFVSNALKVFSRFGLGRGSARTPRRRPG